MINVKKWSVDVWDDTPKLLEMIVPTTAQVIPSPMDRWFDTEAEALVYIERRSQKEDAVIRLARIKAAGPELLAVLEELFDIGAVFGSAIEPSTGDFIAWETKARAAIAKAKG